MWISILTPKIPGKQSKELTKNAKKQLAENLQNTEYTVS